MVYRSIQTIPNPQKRPAWWKDPLGWIHWKPRVAWVEGDIVRAEWFNEITGRIKPNGFPDTNTNVVNIEDAHRFHEPLE